MITICGDLKAENGHLCYRRDIEKCFQLSEVQCSKVLIVSDKSDLDYCPENVELWDVGDILTQLQSSL